MRRRWAMAGGAASTCALLIGGACSSADSPAPFGGAWSDASAAETTTTIGTGYDAGPPVVFGADQSAPSPDAAPATGCPGVAPPVGASGDCVIDSSGACPSCASWGFACTTWASPLMKDASAASFCRATVTDAGGALLCCTQPACIVSTALGGCDASSQTRYDCSGGAVPSGACAWLGAPAPNDYCCE